MLAVRVVVWSATGMLLAALALAETGTSSKSAATATVNGHYKGQKSRQPVPNTLVALCRVTGEWECVLSHNLLAVTDSEGHFVVQSVPVGQYTVAYSKDKKPTDVSLATPMKLTDKEFAVRIQEGSFSMGKLKDGTISLLETTVGVPLSFEVRETKLVTFDVGGSVSQIEVTAYNE